MTPESPWVEGRGVRLRTARDDTVGKNLKGWESVG